jgi:hypothetical protein
VSVSTSLLSSLLLGVIGGSDEVEEEEVVEEEEERGEDKVEVGGVWESCSSAYVLSGGPSRG